MALGPKRFFPLPGVVREGDRVGLRVSNSMHTLVYMYLMEN